jgi:DNA polymerase III subunit epsilon
MDQLNGATSAPGTPWRAAELCVVDVETTGLDPERDEIISFATVPISRGRARLRGARYRVVRPTRMPEAETIVIHGLRSEDLIDAPPLETVVGELIEAISGRALVAHVASIEKGFLGRALEQAGLRLHSPIIDTAELAAELFSRQHRSLPHPIGLTRLAAELWLPAHRPHAADGDALTTAQVFLALATELDRLKPQTVGSLVSLGHRPGPWGSLRRALRRRTRF